MRPAGGDAERAGDVAFAFGANIRQELLALSRRRDTVRVLHGVRVLLADVKEGAEPVLPDADELFGTAHVPSVNPLA